ncbi:MAG: hypothetical protein IJQ14_00630 [Bacteroidales bacterium]|nr:hypothetical protein [Bacteroidales bacterium]
MTKKSLKELDIVGLDSILYLWGQEKKVFQSEAQFQFNLAWRLQELYDCEAKLEDLTVVVTRKNKSDKDLMQKVYTDIVLLKDDYSVAIELKYKTATLNHKDILLFKHGATDLGRYDFWWDVNRLELLVTPTKKAPKNLNAKSEETNVYRHCTKGFAILLTNENDYWKKSYRKDTIDKQFCISEADGCLLSKTLDWKKVNGEYTKTIKNTSRAHSIVLNEAYSYHWESYCELPTEKNNIFKYLMIEVH